MRSRAESPALRLTATSALVSRAALGGLVNSVFFAHLHPAGRRHVREVDPPTQSPVAMPKRRRCGLYAQSEIAPDLTREFERPAMPRAKWVATRRPTLKLKYRTLCAQYDRRRVVVVSFWALVLPLWLGRGPRPFRLISSRYDRIDRGRIADFRRHLNPCVRARRYFRARLNAFVRGVRLVWAHSNPVMFDMRAWSRTYYT